jgi:hypothetical protein
MMTGLAFQTNMPPKKGRLSANTPSPCTGVRISSLCMPCLLAGVEVLQAVGRRAVHDAGAGVERDVVAQVDRRGAVVEGMAELHLGQRRALAGAEHLAFEAEALQCRSRAVRRRG